MKDFKNTCWPFKIDQTHTYAFWEKAFSVEECEVIKNIAKGKMSAAYWSNVTKW